jgi:hypothetical protein
MKIHNRLLVILFLFSCAVSYGQNKKISGRVMDKNGNPIPYASITFSQGIGTKPGAYSNEEGIYSADIPEGCNEIKCSHLDYKKKTESIEGNNTINFVLDRQTETIVVTKIKTKKTSTETFDKFKTKAKSEFDRIFTTVEMNAEFNGGLFVLEKYINKEISKLDSSKLSNVSGVIKISFTIDKDGNSKNVILIKGINNDIDEFVLQVIRKMPRWNPAIQNGHKVEQCKEIKIPFELEEK